MAIRYRGKDFSTTDNGDGTFSLAPTTPYPAEDIIQEYRAARDRVRAQVKFKKKMQADIALVNQQLVSLTADRDNLKAVLVAAGYTPDADLPTTPRA